MDKQRTICFTGLRPKKLFGYQDCTQYHTLSHTLGICLQLLYDHGYHAFLSGGAQGFDQLAFWTVHRQLPAAENHVYIPFPQQSERWEPDGLFGQKNYQRMLTLATSVTDISQGATTVSDKQCSSYLHKRNHSMVDHSAATIALYPHDRKVWTDQGGTAACIRYSLTQQHPVLCLDPFTCNWAVWERTNQ